MSNIVKAPKNWVPGLNNCGECQRCKTRNHIVPGVGNKTNPKLFVILDTVRDGENDSEYGTRFTKAGGKLFNEAVKSLGFNRWEDCYVTSVMKCWKPGTESAGALEMRACAGYLDHEMNAAQPKTILLMGDLAVKFWFETRGVINLQEARGRIYLNNWNSVIATYHPDDVKGDKALAEWAEDWARVKKAYEDRKNPQ